jgi:putative membrane protein
VLNGITKTYVATQGDVWDAHKDIALAAVGAAMAMLITYFLKKYRWQAH